MKRVAGCLAVLVAVLCHGTGAGEFAGTQGFGDFEVRGSLSEDVSCFVSHQSKIRDEDVAYFLWHMRVGLRYKPTPWLQLAVDHRYEEARGAGEWQHEHRTTLEATPMIRLGDWKLSSRNRMEYREFESPKVDRWRYRNEFKAQHPLGFWKLDGYVSEEPQFDFEVNRWSKHRITVGVCRKLRSWLSAKLYYRWDVIERGKEPGVWDKTQIVGMAFVADLDRLLGGK